MAKKHNEYWQSFLDFFLDGICDDKKRDVFERARIDNGSGTIIKASDLPFLFWIFIKFKEFMENESDPMTVYKKKFLDKMGRSFYNTHEKMHREWLKDGKVAAFFKDSSYVKKRNGELNFISMKFQSSTCFHTIIPMIFREWNELLEYEKCGSNRAALALKDEYAFFLDAIQAENFAFAKVWEAFTSWKTWKDECLPANALDAWAKTEIEQYNAETKRGAKLRHYSPAVLKIDYCQLCGVSENSLKAMNLELSAHHLVPLCEGGADDPKNLLVLCPDCHKFVHERRNKIKNEK